MYARVTSFQVKPGAMEDLTSVWQEMVEGAKSLEGFGGGWLLFDPDTNTGMSVSTWETEANLAAFESSDHYRQQLGKVAPSLTGQPDFARYEVAARA